MSEYDAESIRNMLPKWEGSLLRFFRRLIDTVGHGEADLTVKIEDGRVTEIITHRKTECYKI